MELLTLREYKKQAIDTEWFDPALLPSNYRDYFTIEYDPLSRRLLIEPGRYIGIVPLTPDYGIQILPKSGLKSLAYMLYRSGLLTRSLETPFDQMVPYEIPEDDLESFFEGLVHTFLGNLDTIKAWGLLRQTVVENQSATAVRGKIDYVRWIKEVPRTRGLPIPQRVFTPDFNNIANRVLRGCLEYLAQVQLRYVPMDDVLSRLDYFGHVRSTRITHEELAHLQYELESSRFPSSRHYYLPALNLALLIFQNAGLGLGNKQDVTFRPILINTADMFEKYVRVIYQEAVKAFDAHAEDGKKHPVSFYVDSPQPIWVQPDVLVRRGGSTLLVADVKYKFEVTPQDHYQMWAYLHAHNITSGGFVSVLQADLREETNPTWYRRDDYAVFDFAFDFGRIKLSEQLLAAFVARQLELSLATYGT